jgi:hypothetical protein
MVEETCLPTLLMATLKDGSRLARMELTMYPDILFWSTNLITPPSQWLKNGFLNSNKLSRLFPGTSA